MVKLCLLEIENLLKGGCMKTDLFNVDEGRNSCYSADFVFSLLNREGFIWKNEPTDYYDAISDVIIWDRELPQAPSSEKIGMCWK